MKISKNTKAKVTVAIITALAFMALYVIPVMATGSTRG